MWKVLEALKTKTAQREGCAPIGLPQGNLRAPSDGGGAVLDERDVDTRWEKGWQYGMPTQWPKSLPQSTADVSQLLSMLTARLRMGTAHINTFSSDANPRKTEVFLTGGITRSSASRTTTVV